MSKRTCGRKLNKLNEELRYVKTVLRYPRLYHKYYQKEFEEISKGLLQKDIEFLELSSKGKESLRFCKSLLFTPGNQSSSTKPSCSRFSKPRSRARASQISLFQNSKASLNEVDRGLL